MTGSQEHGTIPLLLKDGKKYVASVNGNNAAWLCVCGCTQPLIWSAWHCHINTECPECKRLYIGRDGNGETLGRGCKPEQVEEI